MASNKRRGGAGNPSGEEEDVEMKAATAGGGGAGSPVKIDYELYNEQFGEGSSGKSEKS
jgi:hypothetical protein